MSTSSQPSKPLPELPVDNENVSHCPQELTRQGRVRLRQLLRIALEEARLPDIDRWLDAVEICLYELATCFEDRDWLQGLKLARRRIVGQFPSSDAGQFPSDGSRLPRDTVPRREGCAAEQGSQSLQRLRSLASESAQGRNTSPVKHLLLCFSDAANDSQPLSEDSNLEPCHYFVFEKGAFTLPESDAEEARNTILYGLEEGDVAEDVMLIGGTFSLSRSMSADMRDALRRALRIAVYVRLALLLEHQLFLNSGVLRPTAEAPTRPPRVMPGHLEAEETPIYTHPVSQPSRPSIWTFLSKGLFQRRKEDDSTSLRRHEALQTPRPDNERGIRPSLDETHQQSKFRLSFSMNRPSFHFPTSLTKSEPERTQDAAISYVDLLDAVKRSPLSTSPDVAFTPPRLISALADRELSSQEALQTIKDPVRTLARPIKRPRADERVALKSILGWNSHDPSGLHGIRGFTKHQSLTAVFSTYVLTTGHAVSASTTEELLPPISQPCEPHKLVTYKFFSTDPKEDYMLGDFIERLCGNGQGKVCGKPGCNVEVFKHEYRWLHNRDRIKCTVSESDERDDANSTSIMMWMSCAECESKSPAVDMTPGSYIYSFSKLLELMIYSPSFFATSHKICDHTTGGSDSVDGEASEPSVTLLRHFSTNGRVVTFRHEIISDVFEVRIPRLQVSSSRSSDSEHVTPVTSDVVDGDEEKRKLRREINSWWEAVAKYLDELEEVFAEGDSTRIKKALPRLPSSDDAYFDDLIETPKARPVELLPTSQADSRPVSPLMSTMLSYFDAPDSARQSELCLRLLSELRRTFQSAEQTLHRQLAQTAVPHLNDVRATFRSKAIGARKRIKAWTKKHAPKAFISDLHCQDPDWFSSHIHVVRGSRVIVEEQNLASIVAFTLRSDDYLRELAAMAAGRTASITGPESSFSTMSSQLTAPRMPLASDLRSPDPDSDTIDWDETEDFSGVVARKDHPRDASGLMSLKDVLRNQRPAERVVSTASRVSNAVSVPGSPRLGPSARSKPATELNLDVAPGEVSRLDHEHETATKILHGVNQSSTHLSHVTENSRRSRRPSTGSMATDAESSTTMSVSDFSLQDEFTAQADVPTPTPSGFSFAWTNAMKYMLSSSGETSSQPSTVYPDNYHSLLAHDVSKAMSVGDRPHIQYDWTIGKRLKFSCTVYYARQFEMLRKRCGVGDLLPHSLEQVKDWLAEGGKSRSNFWKTEDDRFVIKSLLDAWNTADLQVLLDLAPSYVRYMESTSSKPSVIAKMLGFFTVEIKNLETGVTVSKADLVVMENLFFQRTISKTFDLKGIQGRRVKGGGSARTLFDGDWIEGQQRALVLVRAESRRVLYEALKADTDFLDRSNIMDYSLLVGVDEEKKELVVGLVDIIGSYTLAKTLEYRAKHNLASAGKQVTVVPPDEYHVRFLSAMNGYFIGCPDKWSRPVDDKLDMDDVWDLPAVL